MNETLYRGGILCPQKNLKCVQKKTKIVKEFVTAHLAQNSKTDLSHNATFMTILVFLRLLLLALPNSAWQDWFHFLNVLVLRFLTSCFKIVFFYK